MSFIGKKDGIEFYIPQNQIRNAEGFTDIRPTNVEERFVNERKIRKLSDLQASRAAVQVGQKMVSIGKEMEQTSIPSKTTRKKTSRKKSPNRSKKMNKVEDPE